MTTDWSIPIDFSEVVPAWMAEIAPDVESALRTTVPHKTGATEESIEAEASGDSVEVSSNAIGGFLERGTAAHPIHTDKPHGLGPFEYNGRFGFHGHDVEHPGTGPDPFVENAIDAGEVDWLDKGAARIGEKWSNT